MWFAFPQIRLSFWNSRIGKESLTQRFASSVDHVIPKEEAVLSFGPEMKPILEVDPGAVVTFETYDCFSGQIQTESDMVTEIDFSKVNPATGPVAVRGAEPGDSLIVEILDIRPGPQGVATIIPGYGQLIDIVESPVTKVLPVSDGVVHFNDEIRFPVRPMVGVVAVATGSEDITNAMPGRHGATSTTTCTGSGQRSTSPSDSLAQCSASATCMQAWATVKSAARASR